MNRAGSICVFGFAGWSGSGKTTLIEQVLPRLIAAGHRVSLVKHAHHSFDVDQPGKDSYRQRQAGCQEVLVTSGNRWALMHELRGRAELSLDEALARLSPCDIALVEGFKSAPIPKLEVWRAEVGKPLLHPQDPNIIGIATDAPARLPSEARRLTVLGLADYGAVATFVARNARVWRLVD